MSPFSLLYDMTNEALLEETGRLAGRERQSTAQLIAAIAEVDARRLYLAQGCSSIYMFCTRVLRLSEHAAYDRVTAARLARRFPTILERLADGTLTLSNLTLIGPYLTADNCQDLLDSVAGKSKREVELLVTGLRPQLAAPEYFRLQLSVSRQAWERLQRVQHLLSYSIPDGDPSRIFEKALALLLIKVERQKFGRSSRPGKSKPPTPFNRSIPAAVRREVSDRDECKCAFVGPTGRCGETRGLEFHHLQPFGAAGATTAENIELRCRAHNQHESESFYGRRASEWRKGGNQGTRPGASSTPPVDSSQLPATRSNGPEESEAQNGGP